jgi:RNA polymerase sigma factor (sigma-70 family)
VDSDFDAFFSDNYDAVRRALILAVGDADVGEEAAQEAFARAAGRWRRVKTMERPVAWVYVVGMNVVRTKMTRGRREKERQLLAVGPGTSGAPPDESAIVVDSLDIRAALDSLPARQRMAVVLRYLADLDTAHVASAMGCAPGTVKSTLHAALSHMRVELEEDS